MMLILNPEARRVADAIGYMNHCEACSGCERCVADAVRYFAIRGENNRRQYRLSHRPRVIVDSHMPNVVYQGQR